MIETTNSNNNNFITKENQQLDTSTSHNVKLKETALYLSRLHNKDYLSHSWSSLRDEEFQRSRESSPSVRLFVHSGHQRRMGHRVPWWSSPSHLSCSEPPIAPWHGPIAHVWLRNSPFCYSAMPPNGVRSEHSYLKRWDSICKSFLIPVLSSLKMTSWTSKIFNGNGMSLLHERVFKRPGINAFLAT